LAWQGTSLLPWVMLERRDVFVFPRDIKAGWDTFPVA
jgi:hypothetical protein